MKKSGRRRKAILALLLVGSFLAGDIGRISIEAKAEEREEITLLNVDFSGFDDGLPAGGFGGTSFGKLVGNSPDYGTYGEIVEDGDNRYATFCFEETAPKNASMTALSYKDFNYDDIVIRIRMRIKDYNGKAELQFRMPYVGAGDKVIENTIKLLCADKGALYFLGEKVDIGGIFGKMEVVGNKNGLEGNVSGNNGSNNSVSDNCNAVEGADPCAGLQLMPQVEPELLPLNQWLEFCIAMDTVNTMATLIMGNKILVEDKAYTKVDGTSNENIGNNFRIITSRVQSGVKAEIDLDYLKVNGIAPLFDPWSRIQLTQEQEKMVGEISRNNQGLHPFLYFTEDDLASLREKIKQERSKEAYKLLEQEAIQIFEEMDVGEYVFATAVGGRKLQKEVAYMAFYGYLAQKEEYLQKAADLLARAAAEVSVDDSLGMNGALAAGDFEHAFVLGYDWLYHCFTEEQKKTVETAIIHFAEWLFNNSFWEAWGSEETKRLAWNWNSVTHGPLGMAAIVLDPGAIGKDDARIRKEWLSRSIQRMAGYCTYSKDSTGMPYEGLSYLGYGMHNLVPLAVAIQSRTGRNWLDEFDHLKQVGTCQMQMNAPFGKMSGYYLNQGALNSHFSTTFYLINLFQDQEGLWGFDKTDYFTHYYSNDLKWAGNCYQLPQIIIFEDQGLKPKKPDALMTVFEKGVVVGRDGYEDTSSMFTFNSATGNQSTWNHPDTNTFGFWAKGEAFIIDLGVGYKASAEHNVVLVDGKGLNAEGGSVLNEGILKAVKDYGNAIYALGDASPSYGKNAKADKADRHIFYGRGKEPYIFTYDDFIGDGQRHEFSVNYYTGFYNTVEFLEDEGAGQLALIHGKNMGNDCFVICFREDPLTLSCENTDMYGKLNVSMTGNAMNMGALFLAPDKNGSYPAVRQVPQAGGMGLELYLSDGRLDILTVVDGTASYSSTTYEEKPSGEEVIDLNQWKDEPVISVDKSILQAAVWEAEKEDWDDYTADSWLVLKNALTQAKSVLEKDEATQIQVDEAAVSLRSALKGLVLRPEADKTILSLVIQEAEEKIITDYTAESWDMFRHVLAKAKDAANDTNISQEKVDEVLQDLQKAMDELKLANQDTDYNDFDSLEHENTGNPVEDVEEQEILPENVNTGDDTLQIELIFSILAVSIMIILGAVLSIYRDRWLND